MNEQTGMHWNDTVQHVVRSATSWFFRPRGPEKWIFGGGIALLLALNTANIFLKYQGPIGDQTASIEIGATGGVPVLIYWALTILGIFLVVGSGLWAWKRYAAEQKRISRKKVLVIEVRGLRDDNGAPLDAAVPTSIEGTHMGYVLDVRQRKDGVIVDPEDLLSPVQAMKTWLHQVQNNNDRANLTVVYGGLASVPFTFLTGVLLDDEGSIVAMDWDRNSEAWRSLDAPDDDCRFSITGLDSIGGSQDVVLAVSVSYQIKAEDLSTAFSFPIVSLTLSDLGSSHWSLAKQMALADQLFGVLKQLDACGVQQIHLVLAAQNSVVFNFGRRYDKRNLPRIAVYQFERADVLRYPWAIQMPVCGIQVPSVVRPNNNI